MASLPDTLETARLLLRRPCLSDATTIFRAYARDRDVTRYLAWRPHAQVDDTQAYIADCLDRLSRGEGEQTYVITEAAQPDAAIGMIGVRFADHSASLGYVLARSFWRQGYMSEAAGALTRHLLAMDGIWRVSALCDVDNLGSAAVMKSIGMSQEGCLRRHLVHPNISVDPRDCFLYAITRDDLA